MEEVLHNTFEHTRKTSVQSVHHNGLLGPINLSKGEYTGVAGCTAHPPTPSLTSLHACNLPIPRTSWFNYRLVLAGHEIQGRPPWPLPSSTHCCPNKDNPVSRFAIWKHATCSCRQSWHRHNKQVLLIWHIVIPVIINYYVESCSTMLFSDFASQSYNKTGNVSDEDLCLSPSAQIQRSPNAQLLLLGASSPSS